MFVVDRFRPYNFSLLMLIRFAFSGKFLTQRPITTFEFSKHCTATVYSYGVDQKRNSNVLIYEHANANTPKHIVYAGT